MFTLVIDIPPYGGQYFEVGGFCLQLSYYVIYTRSWHLFPVTGSDSIWSQLLILVD